MWNCNSIKNLIVLGTMLSKEDGEDIDPTFHKQLIGILIYLTSTHSYMMYAMCLISRYMSNPNEEVCLISRYMANPNEEHMQIVKKALYLRGTLNFGVFYRIWTTSKLLAYTYNDYARDVDDRKNTSRYVFLLCEDEWCF